VVHKEKTKMIKVYVKNLEPSNSFDKAAGQYIIRENTTDSTSCNGIITKVWAKAKAGAG
jgi:hypothetical protein